MHTRICPDRQVEPIDGRGNVANATTNQRWKHFFSPVLTNQLGSDSPATNNRRLMKVCCLQPPSKRGKRQFLYNFCFSTLAQQYDATRGGMNLG